MSAVKKVRVLVADNSVVDLERIVALLRSDPGMDVVGAVSHGTGLVNTIRTSLPDIVVLGINLSNVGALEAIKEIMIEAPTPIVIVSDDSDSGQVDASILALRAGALAVAARPPRQDAAGAITQRFLATISSMAQVKVVRHWRSPTRVRATALMPPDTPPTKIVAIAASTGGPAALQHLLSELPADFAPPLLIVQHIATGFVDGLVAWLNAVCSLKVKLAAHGEPLRAHTVYLAPDSYHLGVGSKFRIALSPAEPIDGFRPSATFLFESVAKAFGAASTHVILTGMGQDGVAGLRSARAAGAKVIAQDEASSVVFGMPGAAISAGVVNSVVPLASVAREILAATR